MKYIENGFITVVVEGEKHNVAFKKTGFRAPWVSEENLDIAKLVEKEAPLMKKLDKAYKENKEDLIAEIESQCILPAFLSGYVESGQTSNQLFDILDNKQFKIASIPDEAKPELEAKNLALQEENEALRAKLSQIENAGSEPESEENEPPKPE